MPRRRSTAATGARPPTTTACTSRPAITRASSSASSGASRRFEPGTQGEHKVSRGFEPALTWSAHYIAEPALSRGDRRLPGARGRRHRCLRRRGPRARALPQGAGLTRREDHHLAVAEGSAGVVSAAGAGAARIRPGCWPPAATSPRRGCWPPIGAASSPGTRRASRSSGGRRTRAPCCSRRSSRLSRSLAKTLRNGGFSVAHRIEDFAGVIDGCAAPRARSPGTWITAGDARGVSGAAPAGPCAQLRDLARRRAGRRPLRRAARGTCSSASRCSAASAMPPRPPWRTWWRCAAATASRVIDCQLPRGTCASLGSRAASRGRSSRRCSRSGCGRARTLD